MNARVLMHSNHSRFYPRNILA
uniref:Uncharacterized protein n=1 Tax=Rhizophora mucronata TaxID=61149 RepID=A0A2P2QAX0_RHIMU